MKTFKILSLFCFLSIFSFSNAAKAQIDVTINPIGLLWGSFSAGADFAVSENLSVEGAIGLTFGNTGVGFDDEDFKYFGLPITVFGKYYFNPDQGVDKFYIDAWLRYVSRSYTWEGNSSTYADYSQNRVGIGFGIGYKIASAGGFVFDIGFGAGRAFINSTKYEDGSGNDEFIADWPDLMFAGKLGIGYRFGSN